MIRLITFIVKAIFSVIFSSFLTSISFSLLSNFDDKFARGFCSLLFVILSLLIYLSISMKKETVKRIVRPIIALLAGYTSLAMIFEGNLLVGLFFSFITLVFIFKPPISAVHLYLLKVKLENILKR